jgi:squalene-hopene/tetraprenyl-beta-curcumene cyclase
MKKTITSTLILGLALAASPLCAHADEDTKRLQNRVEASMAKGFAWLAAQQHPNGSFGKIPNQPEPGEAGITGLALRAMARAPAALRAKNEPAMAKAADYLAKLQQPDGSIANPGTGLTMYRTAIAITALKAYDGTKYAAAIEKARNYLEASQFSEEHGLEGGDPKASPYYGGWGYDKTGTKPEADLSNAEFALEALREAGLPADSPVFRRAQVFLQRCQNRSESNDIGATGIKTGVKIGDDGGFMYDPALDQTKSEPERLPDGTLRIPSYGSMTYAGLLSFLNAGVTRDDPRVRAAYAWIQRNYTLEENPGLSRKPENRKQGLYYYFHTFAKALNAWGEPELKSADGVSHLWARDLAERLVALQKPEGFWVNDVPRWWETEPVLVTSYSLMALDLVHGWLDKPSR